MRKACFTNTPRLEAGGLIVVPGRETMARRADMMAQVLALGLARNDPLRLIFDTLNDRLNHFEDQEAAALLQEIHAAGCEVKLAKDVKQGDIVVTEGGDNWIMFVAHERNEGIVVLGNASATMVQLDPELYARSTVWRGDRLTPLVVRPEKTGTSEWLRQMQRYLDSL